MDAIYISNTDHLAQALAMQPGITALVGGGGKTTLLYALAEALSKRGRVIVTTTTHIFPPDHLSIVSDPNAGELSAAFSEHAVVCVGVPDGNGKLVSAGCTINDLLQFCDYALVEADGAKRLPLKAPAAHEPVIPAGTTHVIAIAGLDGIGRPIREAAFRAEHYAELLCKPTDARIAPKDAALVLQHPQGQRKGVSDAMRFSVLLNKADTPQLRALGNEISAHLDACRVSQVVIASLRTLQHP